MTTDQPGSSGRTHSCGETCDHTRTVLPVELSPGQIESILREYQMHEPACPAREVERMNSRGGLYFTPQPCTCWLSAPARVPSDKGSLSR